MGNADAGAGWHSESHLRDGKRKARGRSSRVRQEDGTDATLRNRDSVEAGEGSSLIETPRRTHIPFEEVFAELHKDPEYTAAYEASEGQWDLVWAVHDARGKMTQEELAKAMGTTQTAVSRLESGRSNPSVKTLERFAKATNKRLQIRFVPLKQAGRTKHD